MQERDFEFEDSDVVKVVKRAASEVPLISDDEDLLADEPGSAPDEDEGSGTLEPPVGKPSVPGYPGKERGAVQRSHPIASPHPHTHPSRFHFPLAHPPHRPTPLPQNVPYKQIKHGGGEGKLEGGGGEKMTHINTS